MAGMFDDLVPQASPSKGGVSFDDLIPKAKAAPAPKRSLSDNVAGFMANVNRGLGVGDELAAGFGTVGDIVTGRAGLDPRKGAVNELRAIGADFGRNMAQQRQTEDSYAAAHPHAASLAQGAGNALTAFVPAGKTAEAVVAAPRAINALRGAVTAGLGAAGYAAVDRGTAKERAQAAADAATPWKNPLTFALGAGAGAMAPATAKAAKPKISPEVQQLRAGGVPLTPGQMRGGLSKATEDAATSLPILGTSIQEARAAGVEGFNHAVANEALADVGGKVPDHIPAGHPTVAYVEKTLGHMYDETIPQGGLTVDNELKAALSQRLSDLSHDMTEEGRKRLAHILDNRVTSRVGDASAVDGATYQSIHSQLGTTAQRFSASQDADQRAIGEGLEIVREEMRNAAARQNPEFAAAKSAIDASYAKFKRLQGAAASPGAEAGMFTPAQYGGAVRRADRSVDKGATARGGALGQDLADAGRKVLPSKIPDSGTATRGMIGTIASAPGALIAGAVGGGPVGVAGVAGGYAATLGGLKLASKAYSPQAIEAANKALDVRISAQQQRAALKQLQQMSLKSPEVARLYSRVMAAARTAGVASTPRNALAQPARP